MNTQTIEYLDGDLVLEGYFAGPDSTEPKPTVLISHAWGGPGEFEKNKAHQIAQLGYNAFAVDMYGKGKRGKSVEENQALMAPFVEDRALLRQRILAGLAAAKKLDAVDGNQIAAMGFCFGGMCVLDLARSGADVKGVASFHGFFNAPDNLPNAIIKARVLALHGYDDPMVPPDQILALSEEMTAAGVDWQIHNYGLTYHAFTNPIANNPGAGTVYSEKADRRSWRTLTDFLAELFDEEHNHD